MKKNDLLFEIGVEEIPFEALDNGVFQLRENAAGILTSARLGFDEIKIFATPRRLALYVSGLNEKQDEVETEVKGPPVRASFGADGKPTKAAEGFAKAQGVTVKELVRREGEGGEYIFAVRKEKGEAAEKVLPEILKELVLSLKFPKAMRWGSGSMRFIRPVRWLLALYGEKVLKLELEGLKSGNVTRGHRFLSAGEVIIKKPEDYLMSLRKAHVLADQKERRAKILKEAANTCPKGAKPVIHDKVLDEVVNLTEYPNAVLGSFPKSHLALPDDVLVTVMEKHQRYFPVADAKGKLTANFVVVSNGSEKAADIIRGGNERVIKSRLADAEFFWHEDCKTPLGHRVERLKEIVFQKDLGTLMGKTERIQKLARKIATKISNDPKIRVNAGTAALLSKADLLTDMVYEFPELQGIMGREYALYSGEKEEVAQAIYEHYLPRFAGDNLPVTEAGKVVALADKFDTVAGYFLAGLAPTGSEDPYSLRRQGQGIVLIILENNLPLNIREICELSLMQYQYGYDSGKQYNLNKQESAIPELMEFFNARLKKYLEKKDYAYDLIEAATSLTPGVIAVIPARVKALAAIHKKKTMEDILTAYIRCKNLGGKSAHNPVSEKLLVEPEEKVLFKALNETSKAVSEALGKQDNKTALKKLAGLRPVVDTFFDKILVMCEDEKVKNNRLALLLQAREIYESYCDFSKVVA